MGTSASYRAGSTSYYQTMAAWMQQRSQAAAREASLVRKMANAAAKGQAAEEAYRQGDIRLATRLFLAVVKADAPVALRQRAKQRLDQLAEEAQQKLQEAEAAFQAERGQLSPGDAAYTDRWPELVRDLFATYEGLVDAYGVVPRAGRQIASQVARQRRLPEYAEVLNEPESAALWQLGQEHELEGHACCAYWVYTEALRLLPAPSARRAQGRLAALQQDPTLVDAAEACRALQECHKLYRTAERLLARDPARARQVLAQIAERAPADSPLYQAVAERLETLSP